MPEPFGIVTYCDDIRQEIAGKKTIVGIYGSEMVVHGNAPAILPKLCVSVEFVFQSVPNEKEFGFKLMFEREGKTFPLGSDINETLPNNIEIPDGKQLAINLQAVISPFQIPGPGIIKARFLIGKTEHKLNSLDVKFQEIENLEITET